MSSFVSMGRDLLIGLAAQPAAIFARTASMGGNKNGLEHDPRRRRIHHGCLRPTDRGLPVSRGSRRPHSGAGDGEGQGDKAVSGDPSGRNGATWPPLRRGVARDHEDRLLLSLDPQTVGRTPGVHAGDHRCDLADRASRSIGGLACVLCRHNAAPCLWLPLGVQEKIYAGNRTPFFTNLLAPIGTVKKVDGGFLISGRWAWATTIQFADWVSMTAKVEGAEGPGSVRAFLAPASSI